MVQGRQPARSGPFINVALIVEGLAVGRAGRTVVAGVGFALPPGGALEVSGPNGAGKSTLLRALAGLLRPEAGHVGLTGTTATLAESCHHLGHADGLKGALTAAENLAFAAAFLAPMGPRDAALAPASALAALGLPAIGDLPVGALSAGQRRRVALARLLVARRPLWVLDEPATALDTEARQCLLGLMEAHREGGGLVVAATHVPLGLARAQALRIAP